jgi:hypothetical protein
LTPVTKFSLQHNGYASFTSLTTIFPSIHSSIHIYYLIGKGKPRGLHAARKLRTERREQRWADKKFKKRALGTAYKLSPFGGASHAKGIVLEKL